ncbi:MULTISPECIES: RNA polymerase sigma factor [Ruminococcus]|uniref:RNA polymerase sigma-70 factor, ECF subfamily n=1 Tax=Ruminococcus flavefaciens TaxID=1265 RepID=A0A1M7H6J3_RUMFL|nr:MULTISPECIES: sigma-70 family RNA polymerase sigma factor [Ruminococcus]MCR4795258.1 sigma-70 family RNA polymerase sigma factor [Ruminococcus sp.]SHM24180.1 RNA polymerase sigma-70 factor, ECF subfamily [Ruminococcus flavefaciens]
MTTERMAELYDKYKNTVYRMAFAYCKNKADAEDIMQEAFIRLFTADVIFEDESKEKSWLLKVTVNKCMDMFRSLRYKYLLNSVPLEEANLTYETPEESEVYHAVMSLSTKYRLVIHLYYYEDYSIKEIGQITGKNESAVQTQLYRARKKLKDILGKELRL